MADLHFADFALIASPVRKDEPFRVRFSRAFSSFHIAGKPLFGDPHLKKVELLHSWRFSRYSAHIHWLVRGHMTSNNETVSRQMPWAGNIAKAMTSNGKQCTVTQSTVHCWPLLHVMAGISARFFKFCCCFVLLHNKSLGKHWDSRETKFTVPLGTSH